MNTTVYPFQITKNSGEQIKLEAYQGKVLLIVNTASQCGLTPQFEGLEKLYQQFHPRGLVILGFPCNQFGGQDPGSDDEILQFCQKNYGVSFPVFKKIEVNGDNAHPLFQFLKQAQPGLLGSQKIKWNFTKFLIDQEGRPVQRFAPTDAPEKLSGEIEKLL